ncbi:hypothetical protein [Paenibacillus alvei]|uniref:hypothetical protein n=1 Tax=Paenibacillus alvei TaxID=44250 RepID=UPI00228029A8|nr:hypothetical protein [Paenibacillus alvei]MCY7487793.1 hypothetical protein [Paenibacillus alvei]
MNRSLTSIILSFLFIFVLIAPIVSAASTTGSVTSYRSQNSAKSIEITGSGKYMKFTLNYNGSAGPDADYANGDTYLYKKTSSTTGDHIALCTPK